MTKKEAERVVELYGHIARIDRAIPHLKSDDCRLNITTRTGRSYSYEEVELNEKQVSQFILLEALRNQRKAYQKEIQRLSGVTKRRFLIFSW